MRTFRGRLAVVVLAVGLLGSGCVKREAQNYGDAKGGFLDACEAGTGDRNACDCAYTKIQAQMTFDEFKKLDARLQDHPEEIPDDLVAMIGDCQASPGTGSTTSSTTG